MSSAAKVGALVITFVALFSGAYFVLGRSVFAPRTATYYAMFADAGGVPEGANVLMAGVVVGSVTRVDLVSSRQAKVTLAVEEAVAIPEGSRVAIPTALIGIGDRDLEIVPPAQEAPRLKPGSTLPGFKQSALASVLPESETTLKELNATLAATRKLLEDPALKGRAEELLASGAKTAEKFGALAARLDTLLAQNSQTLNRVLAQGSEVMADIATTSDELAKFAKSGKLQGQVTNLLDNLDQAVGEGRRLVSEMNALVTDPKLREPLQEILANTKTMSESGTRIADNAEVISKNGITLSEKAIEIAEKASALADDAKAIMEKFRGTIDRIPGIEKSVSEAKVEADLFRESNPGRWRTDATISIPYRNKTYTAGLFDAFESNKVILQVGQPFGPATLRYGVYASKPGLGVDYRLASGLFLRGDVFGVNDPRFDVRMRYEFGGGVVGWLGVDRVFEQNAPTIGIGIRR